MRYLTISLTLALCVLSTAAAPTPSSPRGATHVGKLEAYNKMQPRGETLGLKAGDPTAGLSSRAPKAGDHIVDFDQLPGGEYRGQDEAKAAKLEARGGPGLEYRVGDPVASALLRDTSLQTSRSGNMIRFWRPEGVTYQGPPGEDAYGQLYGRLRREQAATNSANAAKKQAIAEESAFMSADPEARQKNRKWRFFGWSRNSRPSRSSPRRGWNKPAY